MFDDFSGALSKTTTFFCGPIPSFVVPMERRGEARLYPIIGACVYLHRSFLAVFPGVVNEVDASTLNIHDAGWYCEGTILEGLGENAEIELGQFLSLLKGSKDYGIGRGVRAIIGYVRDEVYGELWAVAAVRQLYMNDHNWDVQVFPVDGNKNPLYRVRKRVYRDDTARIVSRWSLGAG